MPIKKLIIDVESQKIDDMAALYGISRKHLVEEILAAFFTLDLSELPENYVDGEPLTARDQFVGNKNFHPTKRKTGCPGWTEERKVRVSAAMKGHKIGEKHAAV